VDPDVEVVDVALVLGQIELAELEAVITCTSAAWLLNLAQHICAKKFPTRGLHKVSESGGSLE
jgi:hypothetical protein